MNNHIFFRRIVVDRMYGQRFDGLELARLSKHINIVYGANASGKSTIARAIQSVLLPKYNKAQHAKLDAYLNIGTGELQVHVDGKRRSCLLDGRNETWNPELIRPNSYHISLHDLLSGEVGDHSFAKEIMKEASGGFDIGAAARTLEFKVPGRLTANHQIAKAVQASKNTLDEVRRRHNELTHDRERSIQLEKNIASATHAQHRLRLLKRALAYCQAKQVWEEADSKVRQFPSVLHRSEGHNLDGALQLLQKCEGELAHLSAELKRSQREISEVEQSIAQCFFPEARLPAGLLEQLGAQIQRLRDTDTRIATSQEALSGHRSEAKEIRESIVAAEHGDRDLSLDFRSVEQLDTTVRQLEKVNADRSALQALEEMFKVEEFQSLGSRDDQLRHAQRYLIDWLREKRSKPRSTTRIKVALWTAATLSAAGTVLVALDDPLGWMGLVVPALIGTSLIWVHSSGQAADQSDVHKQGFQKLGLAEPPSWNSTAVATHLESLLTQHAIIKVDQEKQNTWMAHAHNREALQAEWKKVTAQVKALQRESGLKTATAQSLYFLINRILQYQRAREKVERTEAQLRTTQQARTNALADINNTLSEYGTNDISSADEATATLENMRGINEQLGLEIQRRKVLEEKIMEFEERSKRVLTQKQSIFSNLELADGDTKSLHALARQEKELRKHKANADRTKALMEECARALRGTAGFSEELKSASHAALEAELEGLEARAATRDELQREITAIETRIQDAQAGNALEDAQANYKQKCAALEYDREMRCADAVGGALAEVLMAYTRKQGLPEVFKRARKNFETVTGRRYELRLSDRSEFRAFDTELEREHGLNELSSATRVQLLLCVRVAFVESQESGNRFPLTLDETLANSDDRRAETIIGTIVNLATRRQVIYFTAQDDEVRKWKELAGDTPINVIRLGH